MKLAPATELLLDIPEQLVRDLDDLFPHKCPSISMSEKEIWFYAGQREMVDWLIERREAQEFES